MTINLTLLVLMGALFAVGVHLLLERSLTRVLLGIILISNGVNLLMLQTAGRAGLAPIVRDGAGFADMLDPLPQALVLTAIVISFALTSLMLALIYRSWALARQDEVADDEEDRRVAAQPVHDPEEDSEVPAETSEFSEVDPADPHQARQRGRLLNPQAGRDATAGGAVEDQLRRGLHEPDEDARVRGGAAEPDDGSAAGSADSPAAGPSEGPSRRGRRR